MADEDKILHEDVLQVLQAGGVDTLRNPGLFSSFLLDVDAGRTKSARILVRNCSPTILDPFANAGKNAIAIDQARQRVHAYLTTDCGLEDEVARRITNALESGLCAYYGISSIREQREQEQRERQLELLQREREERERQERERQQLELQRQEELRRQETERLQREREEERRRQEEERLRREAELKRKQASAANQTAAGQSSQGAVGNAAQNTTRASTQNATQKGQASNESDSSFGIAAFFLVALVGSNLVAAWHNVGSDGISDLVILAIITIVVGSFMSAGMGTMIKEVMTNHKGARLRAGVSLLAGIVLAAYVTYGTYVSAVEHGFEGYPDHPMAYVAIALWLVMIGSNVTHPVLNFLYRIFCKR